MPDIVSSRGQITVAETQLKAGALRLPSVLMQGITHIAPAIAALYFVQFIVGSAGLAMAVAYPIGVFFVLLTGIGLAELARAIPSAGGYYTYVARGIHPRAGFLVSWIYMLFSPTAAGPVLVFTGVVFAGQLGLSEGWVTPSRSPASSLARASSRSSSTAGSSSRARRW